MTGTKKPAKKRQTAAEKLKRLQADARRRIALLEKEKAARLNRQQELLAAVAALTNEVEAIEAELETVRKALGD